MIPIQNKYKTYPEFRWAKVIEASPQHRLSIISIIYRQ